MGNEERLVIVAFLVTIMLLAPIAGVVGASGTAATTEEVTLLNEQNVHDEVAVWEEAPLALQADPGDANVSVDIPDVFVDPQEYPEVRMNQTSVGVYEADEDVTLYFGHDVGSNDYDDDEIELVVGYLEENVDEDDVAMSDIPMNRQELAAEFTQENLDNLNDNVSFTGTDDLEVEDGEFSYTDTLDDGSGVYMYIAATEGLDVDESSGDLSVEEPTTILGAEQVVAHDEPSTVKGPSSAEPGDDITFDVNATTFNGDDLNDSVNHAVVLYDNETFTEANEAIITVNEDLDGDLSAEDVTIQTDIRSLNGVQNLEDDVSALGYELESQKQTGVTELSEVMSFLTSQDEVDELPELDEGDIQLDASSTALVGDTSESITVETYENWSETDYQWIHVATGTSSDQIQFNEGEIEIKEKSTGGGGIGGGGGSPADPVFDVTKAGLSASEIAVGESVDVTAKIEETSGDRGGQFTAELIVDGEVVDTKDVTVFGGESEDVTFTRSFDETGEYEIAVNDVTAGTLTVSEDGPEKGPGEGEPGDESAFEITDTSLSTTQLQVGEDVEATATVENTGGAAGTYTAELTVDGQVVDEQTVTLDASESAAVSFTYSFDEAGDYELAISGTTVGTVTVEDDTGLLPVPGFGVPAALAALLAAALLAARVQSTN